MSESTTNLKKQIRLKLETVFDVVVPYGTQPVENYVVFCTYKFTSKTLGNMDNKASKSISLQVDMWRTSSDQNVSVLDNYADDIEEMFNENTHIDIDFDYDMYLTARQDQLPTDNTNTQHTQLLFEVRYNQY